MKKSFEDQLRRLPAKPGVYLFRDERGHVLYVGKAKSLRPRVRSYFQATQDTRTTIRQLPDFTLPLGIGDSQRERALRALALFGQSPQPPRRVRD